MQSHYLTHPLLSLWISWQFPQCMLISLYARCLFLTTYSGGFPLSPSVTENPIHSCTLLLTHKAGKTENLKCSVLYLDSKAASAVCRTICCPLCHGKEGAGIRRGVSQVTQWNYPLLGADTPSQAHAPVTMVNATLPPLKSLFLPATIPPLNGNVEPSPRVGFSLFFLITIALLSVPKTLNPGLHLELRLPLTQLRS